MAQSIDDLREHLQVLEEFSRDYRSYIGALEKVFGSTVPPSGTSQEEQRERILRSAQRAQRALDASGFSFTVTPPPAFGGALLEALPAQVMAHENSLYSPDQDPFMVPRIVLDSLTAAIGGLEDKIEQEERRTRATGSTLPATPAPATRRSESHLPTLWGHLGNLPHGLSVAADVVTVTLGVAAIVAFLINVVF